MEVDDDIDYTSTHNNYDNNRNTSVGMNCMETFASPLQPPLSRRTPNSIGFQNTKMLLNQARRSSSGILLTSMFGTRFRHLQRLHGEAFLGLNAVCMSSLPVGAVFRSSLPATPVATPVHREAFHQFTEQAIRDRLCRTPSPRKNRPFIALAVQQTDAYSHAMDSHEQSLHDYPSSYISHDSSSEVQPMDVTSPSSPVMDTKPSNYSTQTFDSQYYSNEPQTHSSYDSQSDARFAKRVREYNRINF